MPLLLHLLLLSSDVNKGPNEAQIQLCNQADAPRACYNAVTRFKSLSVAQLRFCFTQARPRECMFMLLQKLNHGPVPTRFESPSSGRSKSTKRAKPKPKRPPTKLVGAKGPSAKSDD